MHFTAIYTRLASATHPLKLVTKSPFLARSGWDHNVVIMAGAQGVRIVHRKSSLKCEKCFRRPSDCLTLIPYFAFVMNECVKSGGVMMHTVDSVGYNFAGL